MNFYCQLLLAILLMFFFSCSPIHHRSINKNGSYNYAIFKNESMREPVVTGIVYEYGTTFPLKTNAAIRINGKVMSNTDAAGEFSFSLSSGTYRLEAVGIPYLTLETKNIKLDKGDTLKLNFYLKAGNNNF